VLQLAMVTLNAESTREAMIVVKVSGCQRRRMHLSFYATCIGLTATSSRY